jgi:hypothetical protein
LKRRQRAGHAQLLLPVGQLEEDAAAREQPSPGDCASWTTFELWRSNWSSEAEAKGFVVGRKHAPTRLAFYWGWSQSAAVYVAELDLLRS